MQVKERVEQLCGIGKSPFFAKDDTRLGVKTLQLRIKDKHAATLLNLSRQVNLVWNFCKDLGLKMLKRENKFCSAYDLHPYLTGATKEGLQLHLYGVKTVIFRNE